MSRDKGQLALGVAFAYTTVLALLLLILHSSGITRDKMKMQHATDLAALVAADVQRINLNEIREHNQAIKRAFSKLLAELATNRKPCTLYIFPTATNYLTSVVSATKTKPSLPLDRKSDGDPCDEACAGFDGFVQQSFLTKYQAIATHHIQQIAIILSKANDLAFQKALETFLFPGNLPLGLRKTLEQKFGKPLTVDRLVALHTQGRLNEMYEIVDANRRVSLFEAANENPTVMVWREIYYTLRNPYTDAQCISAGHRFVRKSVPGKMFRASNISTTFVTGARYRPETSEVLRNLQLFVRNPQTGDFLTDARAGRQRLFRFDAAQSPMITLAAARPYGGTYPQKAPMIPANLGETGKKFEGAKLIGIADRKEFGGSGLGRVGSIVMRDPRGNIEKEIPIHAEEFLH